MVRQAPLSHHRAATADNSGNAVGRQMHVLEAHTGVNSEVIDTLLALLDDGLNGEMSDYGGAEQCAMALSATLSALEGAGNIDQDSLKQVTVALDAIYLSLEDEDTYRPEQFLAALSEYRIAFTDN